MEIKTKNLGEQQVIIADLTIVKQVMITYFMVNRLCLIDSFNNSCSILMV